MNGQLYRRCLAGGVLITVGVVHFLVASFGILTPDGSRDLAYAWVVANGQWLVNGPSVGQLFHLGPLYFYLIALPLFFGGSITTVLYLVAAGTSFGAFFAYRLGSLLFNWETGVAFALLFGVDYWGTFAASSLSHIDFLPVVSLGFLWAIAYALTEDARRGIFFSLVWAAVALQVHPLIGTLFPLWLLLGSRLGKEKYAVLFGLLAFGLICTPWAFALIGSHLGSEGASIGKGFTTISAPRLQWFLDAPVFLHQYWTMGGTLAAFWSQAIPQEAVQMGLLHIQTIWPFLALGGAVLAVMDGIRRKQFLPIGFLSLWWGAFWLLFPIFLAAARAGYASQEKLAAWYYYYPLQPLLPLLVAFCCLRLPHWMLPEQWARRTAWAVIGGLAVVLAVAVVASFQSLANQGFLDPQRYLYLPSQRLPFFNSAVEEEITKRIRRWTPGGSLGVTHIHGLPLMSYVQNRGILFEIENVTLLEDNQGEFHIAGVRRNDLHVDLCGEEVENIGAFTIVKYRSPLDYRSLRFSTRMELGWWEESFRDSHWHPLRVPTFSQLPQSGVYPPKPDMAWENTPVYIRGVFSQEPDNTLVAGVTLPASDVGVRQGRLCGIFVNGVSIGEHAVGDSYLQLFSLRSVTRPGENVIAVCVEGSPQMIIDLFMLRTRSETGV